MCVRKTLIPLAVAASLLALPAAPAAAAPTSCTFDGVTMNTSPGSWSATGGATCVENDNGTPRVVTGTLAMGGTYTSTACGTARFAGSFSMSGISGDVVLDFTAGAGTVTMTSAEQGTGRGPARWTPSAGACLTGAPDSGALGATVVFPGAR